MYHQAYLGVRPTGTTVLVLALVHARDIPTFLDSVILGLEPLWGLRNIVHFVLSSWTSARAKYSGHDVKRNFNSNFEVVYYTLPLSHIVVSSKEDVPNIVGRFK